MSVKIDQKKGQRHKYWQRKHSFRTKTRTAEYYRQL